MADGTVHDAELGRSIHPWTNAQVEAVEKQLMRFGPDRVDVIMDLVGVPSSSAA
jgi:hypothetical protein